MSSAWVFACENLCTADFLGVSCLQENGEKRSAWKQGWHVR